MKTTEQLAHEAAMEAAMQILHGGLFPSETKLPTCEQVAKIIEDETDLVWLHGIRRRAEAVEAAQETRQGNKVYGLDHDNQGESNDY